jgi:sugar lactone lactonase YvrE
MILNIPPTLRANVRLLFVLALTVIGVVPAFVLKTARTVSASMISPVPQAQANFVRRITLTANDVVYSPTTKMLYATVPSSAGAGGNSITTVDPTSGTIVNSVYVGSEPNKLAIADDGQTVYTTLDGAYAIRRFDVQSQTPGLQFAVGADSFFGRFTGNDLAVAPGNPNLLAVARYQSSSPPEAGVAVYDNGVQRPNTGPGHIVGSDFIAFSASAATLYGGGPSGGLRTMTVDANGITPVSTGSFSVGARVKFDTGLVFSSTGQVINASSGTLLGTFANVSTNAFVSDSTVGRAYYLTGNSFNSNGTLTLTAFDINTFLPVGSFTIGGVNGTPTTMIRWGSNGLAFRTTGGEFYVVQTALIPSADPIPTPTAASSPAPSPSPSPLVAFVRQINLPTNDLISDPTTNMLYASVPSSVGASGNSITTLDPVAGTVGNSAFIGSEPTVIAQCDDGHTIFVGLDGAGSVRRFDLSSQTAGPEFSLGQDSFFGAYSMSDIAAAPGDTNVVAVSRTFRGTSPPEAGVAIFDNGVQRTKTGPGHINGSDFLAFVNSSKLYGSGQTGLSTMTVDATGVTVNGTVPFSVGSDGLKLNNGLLYGGGGQVLDPNTGAVVGTFTNSGSSFAIDAPNNRIFFLASGQIKAYNLDNFLPIGFLQVQGISGFATGLVRWGANGLAFRTTSGQVFLIQSLLVDPATPIPSPTPTPSPVPSPSPPYIPTFIRRVNLQANDLVINPATQKLYASVPSTQGTGGNSITRIDPSSAAIETSVFVGSEPNKMAISEDGSTIHVSLDGAAAIRQFDVASMTPGLQFNWGTNTQRPSDIEGVPGTPQSIATSDGNAGAVGVAIYDSGVRRTNTSRPASFVSIGPLAFGSNASTLYGYNNFSTGFDFVKFNVDSSGVTQVATTGALLSGFSSGPLNYSNGRLYSPGGRVIDPEARRLLGTFTGANASAMVVDQALGRAFCLNGSGNNPVLTAYDIQTFLPLGSVTLTTITGIPTSLVRWGTNGLAFRVGNTGITGSSPGVYLLQSSLVAPASPVPTGVQFNLASVNAFEGIGALTITVNRTGDVSSTTTVDYATSDGTATAGSDYTATSGTLTFAPGQLSKTFTIPIIDDRLYEAGNETFNVTLSNPSGVAILTSPSTTVVTINDNDSLPQISMPSTFRATEGNSGTKVFSVPVTLSNPSVQTISVSYTTADGTATAGDDYVATSGTLTFPPGTTSGQINITVNGDTTVEPDETFLVKLSNPVNAQSFLLGSQATVTIANDDSTIQFSSPAYSISESGSSLSIGVTRIGDTSVTSSVNYATSDDAGVQDCATANLKASSRCDYITASGVLTFAPGQTSKTITLLVIDDNYVEGDETLAVALSNPSVSHLDSPSAATITITDNDSAPGPNPVDTAGFFVREQYLDFLNREADVSGLDFWTGQMTNCGASDLTVCRVNVSGAFFLSIEFQQTGYLVERMYKVAYGDASGTSTLGGSHPLAVPVVRFNEFLQDTQRIGRGVVVLQPGWEQVLANNKLAYALEFVQTARFTDANAFPTTMTPAQFVDKLNQNAGNVLSPTERATAINLFNGAGDTSNTSARAQALRQVAEDPDLYNAESNRAFVLAQYFGYLRRNPNDPQDTDYTGYEFWLNKLNQFNGDYVGAEMVKAFIASSEYRQRFGP